MSRDSNVSGGLHPTRRNQRILKDSIWLDCETFSLRWRQSQGPRSSFPGSRASKIPRRNLCYMAKLHGHPWRPRAAARANMSTRVPLAAQSHVGFLLAHQTVAGTFASVFCPVGLRSADSVRAPSVGGDMTRRIAWRGASRLLKIWKQAEVAK